MEASHKKILVIDDDKTIIDIISQLLARFDFEVMCADNGYSGLSLFTKRQCDIVLTDYDMPGMDGITVAHHIKEKSPDTPVILMTGHDRASIRDQIENSKVDQVLFKPLDLLGLVHILQEEPLQNEENLARAVSV
jgi:two-component system, NtrC family, nitrogen regulation response regulator NtrX